MNILTERRRWWIAGITLTVSLGILIFGEKPSRVASESGQPSASGSSSQDGSAPADNVPGIAPAAGE